MEYAIVEIRWSLNHLNSTMLFSTLVRWYIHIESAIAFIIKSVMNLLIHSQISTVPLEYGSGQVI